MHRRDPLLWFGCSIELSWKKTQAFGLNSKTHKADGIEILEVKFVNIKLIMISDYNQVFVFTSFLDVLLIYIHVLRVDQWKRQNPQV